MMIIVIGGEKGGTGKTTISTNLAAMRAINGHDVLLIDTDKQGSSSSWCDVRSNKNITPLIPNVQKFGKSLIKDIDDIKKRYEDIIIDTGGRDTSELRASMCICNKMYIPIKTSQFDIWSIGLMTELVNEARFHNKNLECNILINMFHTNPNVSEIKEAKDVLSEVDDIRLSDCFIGDRIIYRKAAKNGLSIVEFDKKQDIKAISEITNLYNEVFNGR